MVRYFVLIELFSKQDVNFEQTKNEYFMSDFDRRWINLGLEILIKNIVEIEPNLI